MMAAITTRRRPQNVIRTAAMTKYAIRIHNNNNNNNSNNNNNNSSINITTKTYSSHLIHHHHNHTKCLHGQRRPFLDR